MVPPPPPAAVVVWGLLSLTLPPEIFPGPIETVRTLWGEIVKGDLWIDLAMTMLRVVGGLVFALLLGVPVGAEWGPFIPVKTGNGVTMDFVDGENEVRMQHYAFLVDDAEFDAAFARIKKAGLTYWADPHKGQPGEINHHWGGRGVYFEDPNGHLLEIITRPYGSGGWNP